MMRNFKKCLIMMFAKMGKDVIFLETCMKPSQQKHTVVEAIPLPGGKAAQASGYFKTNLETISAEEEFEAVHKRIIDTRGKGLRASIPKNFPYFHVEFGINGGYLHMIEDEENWDRQFGHHVCAGMIKKEHKGKLGESQKDGEMRHWGLDEAKKGPPAAAPQPAALSRAPLSAVPESESDSRSVRA